MTLMPGMVQAHWHGTYAGLAHPAMIDHFLTLGVTSIELLPVHAFATEPRLLQHGLTNYWGYNSVNFFTPHGAYATEENRRQGPEGELTGRASNSTQTPGHRPMPARGPDCVRSDAATMEIRGVAEA